MEELTELSATTDPHSVMDQIEHAINGKAYSELRSRVPLDVRRAKGTFFTSEVLGEELISLIPQEITLAKTALDPCCGAGNLLLSYAKKLPVSTTLKDTIEAWGKVLFGFDTSNELVIATKLRLALLAKQRGRFPSAVENVETLFPNIFVANALKQCEIFGTVDFILLNPPYQSVPAPDWYNFGAGKVSTAALFVDHVCRHLGPSTKVFCILPEVIRCGTRYRKLRENMAERVSAQSVQAIGVFDSWTDIDVFITELSAKEENKSVEIFAAQRPNSNFTVNDFFEVKIGPVVAYRSPKEGELRPYLETKTTPAWAQKHESREFRRFSGTVFKPPFVVVRRTSRPGDKYRAIGTIVRGKYPVAVENHLIVLRPKTGTVKQCKKLLRILKSDATTQHLDNNMRCRHLTVKAVKDIPWSQDG
ncbi:MAG: N-6 DNA methylase [Magnetovibrionaceae bacterium]